jgi:hypothetical protein
VVRTVVDDDTGVTVDWAVVGATVVVARSGQGHSQTDVIFEPRDPSPINNV